MNRTLRQPITVLRDSDKLEYVESWAETKAGLKLRYACDLENSARRRATRINTPDTECVECGHGYRFSACTQDSGRNLGRSGWQQ